MRTKNKMKYKKVLIAFALLLSAVFIFAAFKNKSNLRKIEQSKDDSSRDKIAELVILENVD